MEINAIIVTAIAVLCMAVIVVLLIKLSKTNKKVEQIAADNLKRGKEEAAEFVRLTMDKVQEDKNRLNEMSDRELMIETMLALAGHGRRLDRIEEKLQGIYNYKAYTEGLAEQIKVISGMAVGLTENITGSSTAVAGFKQLVNATRTDIDKLNTSISDVESVKDRISFLIENISNSLGELKTLNDKLTTIERKIQGIYEYKIYLDEIVEQVAKVKSLSEAFASSITENDNKVRGFNQTVLGVNSGVNKLSNILSGVEDLKPRIAAVVEKMNKSVYEIDYLSGKITEIVTVTNEVLQTYGDAPMVKLTNIEENIKKVKEVSQRTDEVVRLNADNIEAMKNTINKALADEYEYDSVYYRINNVSSDLNSLGYIVEEVKSTVRNIEDDISNNIGSLDSKVDDVKSMMDSMEYDVRDIKDTVENLGNRY